MLIALLAFAYIRPLPQLKPTSTINAAKPGTPINISWPNYGQSAIGAVGYGVLATSNSQKAVPMASTAKLITALVILQEKPLQPGEQGPLITLTRADVDLYEKYYRLGGSVTMVAAGGQLSEYQALQALLLPSSNNIADSLAIWAFGSVDNYLKTANQFARTHGLKGTKLADATGFSEQTLSTASNLVSIGEKALASPIIAEIVNQPQATIPTAGVIRNVNRQLGQDGIIGIKTGSTESAGGCYVVASKRIVAGRVVTTIGAIMGAPDLAAAMADSRRLLDSSDAGFEMVEALRKGQRVGEYSVPWGGKVEAVAKDNVSALVWKGSKINLGVRLEPKHAPIKKSSAIGVIELRSGRQKMESPAIITQDIAEPTLRWRFLR